MPKQPWRAIDGDPACAPNLLDPRRIRTALLRWYTNNKRDLPWRRDRDPYRVWISEIMLQQTRVAAVIPFYERFLTRFPTVRALAQAREHDVLAAWAGLGYYSRARNLQQAAKKILELGAFPGDYADIRELSGIGDYTAAAIASIAFQARYFALDGNAIRVLARLTNERGDVGSGRVRQRLLATGDRWIDPKQPGEFNQAVMELGATVCLPRDPACGICPMKELCAARALGCQKELPLKVRRAQPIEVEKRLVVIEKAGRVLAWQRGRESRRLAGFWELPETEQVPGARLGAESRGFRHTIVNTNFRYRVYRGTIRKAPSGFTWLPIENLNEFALSTAARKALSVFSKQAVRNDK